MLWAHHREEAKQRLRPGKAIARGQDAPYSCAYFGRDPVGKGQAPVGLSADLKPGVAAVDGAAAAGPWAAEGTFFAAGFLVTGLVATLGAAFLSAGLVAALGAAFFDGALSAALEAAAFTAGLAAVLGAAFFTVGLAALDGTFFTEGLTVTVGAAAFAVDFAPALGTTFFTAGFAAA